MINKAKKLLLLLLVMSTAMRAYTPSETAEISMLTASSGKEVYKIYGHSAIRFQDKVHGRDIVYNYGLFSFSDPDFLIHYLQGQNYYLLGKETFKRFMHRYDVGGEKVTQQTLNLTTQEVKTLFAALEKNAEPEHREYLYNVFFDNCATRDYKIIEDNLSGGVIWSDECQEASFRELLHEYNYIMPFSQIGIDIIFGTKADKITSCMEQMFLPEKLLQGLNKATKSNGEALVSHSIELLHGRKIHNHNEIILFNAILGLLLIFALFAHYRQPQLLRGFQIAIYTLVGLLSLIVCFIAFCSIHPTVFPNPNLFWINPLWLFFAVILIAKRDIRPVYQKALNIWSMGMAFYIVLGAMGCFYLHYGLLYIISILIIISYKKTS